MPIETIPVATVQYVVTVEVHPDGSIRSGLNASMVHGSQPPAQVLIGTLVRAIGEIISAQVVESEPAILTN